MQESTEEILCFNCKKKLDLIGGQKISRKEECPYCYADIHSCKMCRFYDKTVYNECVETQAPRITEKDKANFCDYFYLYGGRSEEEVKKEQFDLASQLFKDD